MDLDARPYRAFVTIADLGSFRRAAEVLHTSQPALSAQLREFERRIGFDLFTRTSRRIALTPEGRLFLDKARKFVVEADWIIRSANEIRSNQLRIGAAHHTSLIAERCALIDDFIATCPDVPVTILGRSPMQLREDLSRGDIDVAIQLEPGVARAEVSADTALQRIVVAHRTVRLAVPRDHPLAKNDRIELSHMRGLAVGVVDRSHGVPLAEWIIGALVDVEADRRHLPEGDAVSVMRQAARRGICAFDLGWFPLPSADLVSIPIEGWGLFSSLVVLSNPLGRREGTRRFLVAIDNKTRSTGEESAIGPAIADRPEVPLSVT